ncbi:MFS transporter [Mycolicibacterium goodii]|uniref:MFS transporter n=1 Tax=Mycolicibacterium goodii TaxID=134601 RepID=UPI00331393F4
MATFVFGVVEAPVRGWTHPSVWGAMAGGVALGAAFTVVELRRTHPLLDVRLFGDPHFATGSAGVTFLFFASFGFFFVSMQYIQLVMGYSPIATAVALCPLAVPILAFGATTHRYLPLLGLRLTASFGLLLTAVGLRCLRTLEIGSSYLDFAWPLLIMSVGIGLCTAPATSAIMGAVPDEKQGVASAVNDTTREVGAALGIAVAGSVLAAQYEKHLAPALGALPEAVRAPALNSLAEALAAAGHMGPQGVRLTQIAQQAFLDATGSAVVILGAVIAVAAVLTGVWGPGRDGQQLGVIRRLRTRRTRPPGGRSWRSSRAAHDW